MKQDNNAASQSGAPTDIGGDSTFGTVFGEGENSQINNTGASEFGKTSFGDTNAVGEIFKSGSLGGDDKKKKIIFWGSIFVLVGVMAGIMMYVMNSDGEEVESIEATVPEAIPSMETTPAEAAITPMSTDVPMAETQTSATDEAPDDVYDAPVATGATINDGTYQYDERKGGPVINASAGARIEVSRSSDFAMLYVNGIARDGKFRIPNPPPGEIFWRISGQDAHKITVLPPHKLNISFSAPSTVTAGGVISWDVSGSANAAFFRVEIASDKSFGNIVNVISSSQNSVALKDVSAGKYQMRVGGFNEQAGRWEYSNSSLVEIQ